METDSKTGMVSLEGEDDVAPPILDATFDMVQLNQRISKRSCSYFYGIRSTSSKESLGVQLLVISGDHVH